MRIHFILINVRRGHSYSAFNIWCVRTHTYDKKHMFMYTLFCILVRIYGVENKYFTETKTIDCVYMFEIANKQSCIFIQCVLCVR